MGIQELLEIQDSEQTLEMQETQEIQELSLQVGQDKQQIQVRHSLLQSLQELHIRL
jgi:hypothetical protein